MNELYLNITSIFIRREMYGIRIFSRLWGMLILLRTSCKLGFSYLHTITVGKILNNFEQYQKLAPAEGLLDSILQCPSLPKNVLPRSGIIKLWVATQSLAARSFNVIVNSKYKANFMIYKRWSKLLVLIGSQGQCHLRFWVLEKGTSENNIVQCVLGIYLSKN